MTSKRERAIVVSALKHAAPYIRLFKGKVFVLKAGGEVSSFGNQVEQYAGIYTSRATNLTQYSPMHYFQSPRHRMPHEL